MKLLCGWCGLEVHQEDGVWIHRDKLILHLPMVNEKNVELVKAANSSTPKHKTISKQTLHNVGETQQ